MKCCLCGKEIAVREGNNPWPAREYSIIGTEENRCCKECNDGIVLPLRISMFAYSDKEIQAFHEQLLSMSYSELKTLGQNIKKKL